MNCQNSRSRTCQPLASLNLQLFHSNVDMHKLMKYGKIASTIHYLLIDSSREQKQQMNKHNSMPNLLINNVLSLYIQHIH